MGDEIVILITAGTSEEAGTIARTLVDEHLVACVNIVPGIRSFFFWDGRTQEAQESLLICKSRLHAMAKVQERVKTMHSYTVPEIIALPVVAGLESYLAWVGDAVKG